MNDISYIFIIIILSVFMVFYGGHNPQKKIIYDIQNFSIYNTKIDSIRNIIHSLILKNKLDNIRNYDINKIIDITNNFSEKEIPNCSNVFLINIKSNSLIKIHDIINFKKKQNIYDKNNNLMIMFYLNDKNNNYLDLIINENNTINEKYKMFYELNKKINITDLENIYNFNKNTIQFILIIIKKPYWYN